MADQEGASISGSDDEGQTTDVEAQSDKEEEVESAWWGKGAVDDEEKKAKVGDGAGDSCAADEREERRRRTEQLRRSLSSSPMKLRVRVVVGWLCGSFLPLFPKTYRQSICWKSSSVGR